MKLTCSKCRFQWEAGQNEGRAEVECPKCGARVAVPSAQNPDDGSDGEGTFSSLPTSPSPIPHAAEKTVKVQQPIPPPPPTQKSEGRKISPKEIDLSGRTIGGFRILKMLGAGGMGAVCLAHQISLDRKIALKILPTQMASNPGLLMRFTREALSAAQMTHHNIIQIYDIGNDQDIHYISMEYVRGETLTDVVRKNGRLKNAVAAGYILQGARGLQYAHDHGVIHRDIKPDNMMLNESGVIKIADMGLAKMRGVKSSSEANLNLEAASATLERARGDLTMSEVAMGTPAFMPPEQARDAATVDHRADQYSLGCTFYFLCAGRAPFAGTTALELITKHISEPLEPIEHVVAGFPRRLSVIISKMMAKEPQDRYPSMIEVIADLEAFMGVEGKKGTVGPRESDMKLLKDELKNYYEASAFQKRRLALLGFFLVIPLAAAALALAGAQSWAAGVLGIAFFTPVAKFIFEGISDKTYLFRRVRHFFSEMSAKGWIASLAGVALLVVVLGWGTIAAVGGSSLCALGYLLFVKRPLRAKRREPILRAQDMLKELRLRGVSEEALQDFVARYSGENWEEFFEEIFGYEAMIQARAELAEVEKGTPRKHYATWREPIARGLDRIEKRRKEARERRRLSDLEAERLKAAGVTETEARKQADQEASRIIRHGFLDSEAHAKFEEKSQDAPAKGDRKAKVIRGRARPALEIDQWIRLAAGLGLCGVFGAYSALGLQLVPAALKLQNLDNILGLLMGVLLIISAFSCRTGLTALLLVGAVLVIGMTPIAAMINYPLLDDKKLLGIGVLLVLIGFGGPVLYRLTGQKF